MPMHPARHADMEGVRGRLCDEYHYFIQNARYTPADATFYHLLENRFSQPGKPVLRGYYVDLIARYLEAETGRSLRLSRNMRERALPFIAEALMVVMYYDNQILDGKAGVTSHSPICNNLLQSNILLSELYQYAESRVRPPALGRSIERLIREVYEVVNIGQQMEQNQNRYENWRDNKQHPLPYRGLPFDEIVIAEAIDAINRTTQNQVSGGKQAFLEAYIRRVYLANAYLFVRFTQALCGLVPDFTPEAREKLIRFAGHAGLALQMINDVIDFVPARYNRGSQAKTQNDAFSDLRNRNITLPLLLHFEKVPDGRITAFLEAGRTGQPIPEFDECQFCLEALDSGAIDAAQQCAVAIKRLALIELNPSNEFYPLLKDVLSIVHGSADWNTLKRIKRGDVVLLERPEKIR